MTEIGTYLQEHVEGEVSLSPSVREAMSRDGSILKLKPDMVIYPKTTNDIRKVTRFSWQLAERGHVLPITARGGGSDQTGAAIGKGIVLSLPAHMNRIFEYEPKQQLVRLQPGVMGSTLAAALDLQGVGIPALPSSLNYSTLGGAVANNANNIVSGKYGFMSEWIDQLEVVLANGEVIQTGRISKRELSHKKGLGTLEGEIYREIDNIIEENKDLVEGLALRANRTSAGYTSIGFVKQRDGSFDLTPLFVGSQGTLGIITEMILKTSPLNQQRSVIVASFDNTETARDVIEAIAHETPVFLEYFDSRLFKQAEQKGEHFNFLEEAGFEVKAVLLIGFDDENARARNKHLKKVGKLLSTVGAWYQSEEDEAAEERMAVRSALLWVTSQSTVDFGEPTIFDGAYVPSESFSVFETGVKALAKEYGMQLPIYGQELSNLYYIWPPLQLNKIGDRQKVIKLLDDYARLIQKVGGELVGVAAEGRLKARFALLAGFEQEVLDIFTAIKTVFDPYNMLNPGVKQVLEMKQLVPMIQADYKSPALPDFIPYI